MVMTSQSWFFAGRIKQDNKNQSQERWLWRHGVGALLLELNKIRTNHSWDGYDVTELVLCC